VRATRAVCVMAGAWLGFAASPVPAPELSYALEPVVAKNGTVDALAVTLTFRGPASGTLTLDLPNESEGEKARWRFLTDFNVTGARLAAADPATRTLTFVPGAPVTVRYRVHSAYDGDPPGADGNPYRGAVVRPSWFATLGEFVFAVPQGSDAWPANFHWGALPRGWTAASDLEHGTMGRAMTGSDILESTLIGGVDVKVLSRPISGGTLRLAVRGTWRFSTDNLADVLARTLSAQRDFWGNDVKGPFLVTLLPLTGSGSTGGTGRSDGFALYGTADITQSSFQRTIAHEHSHTWIPGRIGTLRDLAQEPLDYWFSEGFTDFYASRTLLKSGVWSLEDFTGDLNDRLLAYDVSPSRNASNSEIAAKFWTDDDIAQLPYRRGMLLAFVWDKRLRDAGKANLDAVMFAARDRFTAAAAKPNAAENFLAAYRSVSGDDLGTEIARFVTAGETVSLPHDLFGACARVDTIQIASFDRGFDGETSAKSGVITGVAHGGPAYAAGLRDGMKRIKREGGKEGDSRVPIGYRVADGQGRERLITYLPTGKGQVTIQQVVLTPGRSDAARRDCVRSMAGG